MLVLSYKPAGSKGALECTLAFVAPEDTILNYLCMSKNVSTLFKSSSFEALATEVKEISNCWAFKILQRAAASIFKVPLNY